MTNSKPLAVIRGAGDLASGVAYRLYNSGVNVIMTEISKPLVVRRTVSFAEAVYEGKAVVEGIEARLVATVEEAMGLLEQGVIPILVDPEGNLIKQISPTVVVDARMAKRNLGTSMRDAQLVIGLGPGFTAGQDVHAVIETCRGHRLGRVIYKGTAIPDTATPGAVDGYTLERLLRAPVDGIMAPQRNIGDRVEKGDLVALVGEAPVYAEMSGLIRGMLKDGVAVPKGTKIGDIDPRIDAEYETISDKALAIGGGVLEAVYHYLNSIH